MVKNDKVVGKCIDYTYDGLGVVKVDDFTLFVKDMVKGETGEIIVTAIKKGYGYGRLINLSEKSENRAEALCEISKPCGGCQLQHLSKQEQAVFKHDHVQQVITSIGKLDKEVLPIIEMDYPQAYRNKMMVPVGLDKNGDLQVGFYRYNSHDIIPFQNCLLQSAKANQVVQKLKELIIKYHLEKEIRHLMIRDMERTSQMMLVLVTYKQKVDLTGLVKEIVEFQPDIKSVIQSVNGEETNVVLGKKEILLDGREYIEDYLCGLTFEISAHSFYQVNTYQTEVLYKKAIELANISKQDEVLDLYCGVGTIGLIVSQYAKKVTGVEIIPEAIEDAKKNAKKNKIENIEFICGDAARIASEMKSKGKVFDCVIVDPPRKGCSQQMIDTLLAFEARKIVYISCNPSTLARDLALLKEDYNIEQILPVDMFPNTYHVETVVL